MLQALSRLNPEFQRNLWKEFSLHRLIAMPLILGVIFYVSSGEDFSHTLPHLATNFILLLLVVWGTGLSADAIFEEIQDHTWETQRMTPLNAWSMAWGKLFGATSYVWYGTFICVIVFCIARAFNTTPLDNTSVFFNHPAKRVFDLCYCILTGIAAQAFAFFCALLVQRISPVRSRTRITLIQIFTIIVFLSAYFFGEDFFGGIYSKHSWYDLNISYSVFLLSSLLFIIFWLMVGIYRLLRVELQVKSAAWVWPLFVISWVIYCLGFVYLSSQMFGHNIPNLVVNAWDWGVAYFITIQLTFLAAFFAPKNIIHAYRLVQYLKERNYPEVFFVMPAWILSAGLACIFLIPFVYYALQGSEIEGKIFSLQLTGFAFSIFLFLLRDIGILYFLCWNPKAKRAHLATVIYLVLLYVFIPKLLSLFGLPNYWLAALSPNAWFTQTTTNIAQIISVNFGIFLQIMLVVYGIAYRWRQNKIG